MESTVSFGQWVGAADNPAFDARRTGAAMSTAQKLPSARLKATNGVLQRRLPAAWQPIYSYPTICSRAF